jgi:hypothetical protein
VPVQAAHWELRLAGQVGGELFGGCECEIIGQAGTGQLRETGRAGTSVTGPRGSRVAALATTA